MLRMTVRHSVWQFDARDDSWTVSVQDSHVAALLSMTMRLSRWQFAVQDDSLLLMVKVWHSVLHAIRDSIPVMLSGAKHLSCQDVR